MNRAEISASFDSASEIHISGDVVGVRSLLVAIILTETAKYARLNNISERESRLALYQSLEECANKGVNIYE